MSNLADWNNTQLLDETLKRLWLYRLPNSVKQVLSMAQDTKLEELAAQADKIMENMQSTDITIMASTSTVTDLVLQFTAMIM